MKTTQVLKQAWQMVWRYRALWFFGALLALTTVSWGAFTLADYDSQQGYTPGIEIIRRPGETYFEALDRVVVEGLREFRAEIAAADRDIERLFADEFGIQADSDLLGLLAILAWVALGLYVVGKVVRYVSETALIRMVADAEETGERRSVWHGLRLGVSRAAVRLFLIDLVIDVPILLAFIALFAMASIPLALGVWGEVTGGLVTGGLLTGGLVVGVSLLVLVTGVVLGVLKQFIRRACALEDLGVKASIRHGYAVARRHLQDVGVLWLILAGVRIIWPFVLLPIVIAAATAASVAGAVPALASYGLARLAWTGAGPVLLAVGVGLVLFFAALALPLALVNGWLEVFVSSSWTLTYRELTALPSAEPARARHDAPGLEAVPVG